MNTNIVSLNITNLFDYNDEDKILCYFKRLHNINKVTVNIIDRNVIVSGKEISKEYIKNILFELGYKIIK